VISRRDFHPFGEEISTVQRIQGLSYTDDTVRQKFTSYERDNESNLDFAQARMYGYNHGRFTSPDVLGGSIGDPQTLNKYSYVMNNPVNLIDPSGYCGTTAGSTDGSPCIWIYHQTDGYRSVSQNEFGDGSNFAGYSRVENPDSVVLNNPTFSGTYAEVAKYQYYQANGISVQLGSDGMFYGVGRGVNVTEDSVNSLSDFFWQPIVEGAGSAGEQMIGQDYLPDSIELSGGFLGLSGTGKLTRNGDVLGGVSGNGLEPALLPFRKTRPLPSTSLMFNKTLRFGRLSPDQRTSIESGTSFVIGGGSILGGQITYIPGSGDISIGVGFTTPGVYGGVSHLRDQPIYTVPFSW
jgi:RHS repeat-associated protein